jgi:hypothetical protein
MNANDYAGFSPELRVYLGALGIGLPPIRGKWFVVDPYGATYPAVGSQPGQIVADLKTAYDLCTSGFGDGILILSGGTGTASQTTSYLDTNLVWVKYGITVIGAAAPNGYFGRARISSRERTTGAITTISFTADHTISDSAEGFLDAGFEAGDVIYVDTNSNTNDGSFTISAVTAGTITTTAGSTHVTTESAATAGSTTIKSYCAPVITVTGQNNAFYNLHTVNGGSIVQSLGGISVQGNRNYFKNCHIIGASNTTAGAVASTQFDIEVGASEIVFDDCIFGTNSTLWGAANGHIKLGNSTTAIGQVFFNRCRVISNSATAGHGAIYITNAATLNGWIHFNDCTFVNWQSGAITALTTAIIGETPNNTGILLHNCGMVGWSAWGANNDKWCTTNAAGAAGTGGIAGVIA